MNRYTLFFYLSFFICLNLLRSAAFGQANNPDSRLSKKPTIVPGKSNNLLSDVTYIRYSRLVGGHIIPVDIFSDKKALVSSGEIKSTNGFYYDTIKEANVCKYYLPSHIAVWINSASVFAFDSSWSNGKLSGEGYFETEDNPMTIYIYDSVKLIIDKNSKFNLNAYKEQFDPRTLAVGTLLKGSVRVVFRSKKTTVTAPHNELSIDALYGCSYSVAHNNINEATSWTRLKFDYENADPFEIAERVGRRYGVPIEIPKKDVIFSFRFHGSFNESLQEIVRRLDSADLISQYRLENNKIVLSISRDHIQRNHRRT